MFKSNHIITSKHYLVLSSLAFALGIFLTVSLNADILFASAVFLAVLFVILAALLCVNIFRRCGKKSTIKHLLLPLFLIFCLLLGMLRIVGAEFLFPSELKNYCNSQVWLSGTVTSPVTSTSTGFSSNFELRVEQIDSRNIRHETIIVYIPNSRSSYISEGDQICCWTEVKLPDRDSHFDNFDYYTHLRGKQIFYIGETKNTNPVTIDSRFSVTSAVMDFGRFVKNKTVEAVDSLIPENKEYAAILKGILTGDKADFSDELYTKFSLAGLSHIVAVSGMHLSILFSMVSLVLYKFRAHRKLAYILSIPVIAIFAATAEFTPSVCRSAIMLLMMICAMLMKQRYTPINALFLSLAVILAIAPYSLFSRSLLLSFGATLGILVYFGYLAPLFKKPFEKIRGNNQILSKGIDISANFFTSSLAVSLASCVGTMYFSAKFFNTVSLAQFFTNLWIIPTVTATFCLGLSACVLYYLLPHLTMAVFCYPLRACLWTISATADFFGKEIFALHFAEGSVLPIFFVIYLGAALVLYLLLKTFSDMRKEKESEETDL